MESSVTFTFCSNGITLMGRNPNNVHDLNLHPSHDYDCSDHKPSKVEYCAPSTRFLSFSTDLNLEQGPQWLSGYSIILKGRGFKDKRTRPSGNHRDRSFFVTDLSLVCTIWSSWVSQNLQRNRKVSLFLLYIFLSPVKRHLLRTSS